jgi:hypothetical protein
LGWLKLPIHIAIGEDNWLARSLVANPWYPILFVILCGSAGLLWYFRRKFNRIAVGYGFYVLGLLLCILGGIPLNSALMVFGGLYLLWYSRNKVGLIPLIYGFFAYGLILTSGSTMSVNRYAFGIVSVAIALAVVFKRYPRWGYATLCCFAILLASFSVQFAQGLWLG